MIRLGATAFDRRSSRGRISNYISFICLAAVTGIFLRRRDLIICGTDPPLAILAAAVARRGRPLVYSIQDLHPDAVEASGIVRSRWLIACWEAMHRWGLRRCDHVVCLGSAVARRVQEKGVPPSAISVIRTGSDEVTDVADAELVKQLRGGSDFVVVHAGNLGTVGPWEEIAGAAERVENIRFLFVGEGVYADVLRDRGLEVRPFLPRADLASVMAAGDLQIVALKPGLAGSVVPSKLYTALSHGRPILGVVPSDSEVAEIIRTWDCGVIVEPNSEKIASCLASLATDPKRMEELRHNARRAATGLRKSDSLEAWVSLVERLT